MDALIQEPIQFPRYHDRLDIESHGIELRQVRFFVDNVPAPTIGVPSPYAFGEPPPVGGDGH